MLECKKRTVNTPEVTEALDFLEPYIRPTWLIPQFRHQKEDIERLAGELMDAANNGGGAVRRKEETHRMAESNKAFSHFRY